MQGKQKKLKPAGRAYRPRGRPCSRLVRGGQWGTLRRPLPRRGAPRSPGPAGRPPESVPRLRPSSSCERAPASDLLATGCLRRPGLSRRPRCKATAARSLGGPITAPASRPSHLWRPARHSGLPSPRNDRGVPRVEPGKPLPHRKGDPGRPTDASAPGVRPPRPPWPALAGFGEPGSVS